MLFEKLTQNEIATIEEYIRNYASAMDEEITAPLDLKHILRFWDDAKDQFLGRMFGGELTISKEISMSKPIELLERDFRDMLDKNRIAADLYYEFHYMREGREWYDLTSIRTLVANEYTGIPFEINCPNGKTIKVVRGCKPLKTMLRVAKAWGQDIEEIRQVHSLVLNQKVLKGELCLSIHPLDYLTMSDNDYGWETCMSWMQRGEYRLGTVEMMNSPCVVVAYLKGNSPFNPVGVSENFAPVSNKKWRQLIIVSDPVISGIKGYPYVNSELSELAISWIKELAESVGYGPYTSNSTLINQGKNRIEELDRSIRFEIECGSMYNDFHRDHPSYINLNCDEEVFIDFSGAAECMQCGGDIAENPNLVLCCHCEEVRRCPCCDEPLILGQACETVEGLVCEDCYANNYAPDAVSGQMYNEYSVTRVAVALSETCMRNGIPHRYCLWVADDNLDTEECRTALGRIQKSSVSTPWGDDTKYYLTAEDATYKSLVEAGLANERSVVDFLIRETNNGALKDSELLERALKNISSKLEIEIDYHFPS